MRLVTKHGLHGAETVRREPFQCVALIGQRCEVRVDLAGPGRRAGSELMGDFNLSRERCADNESSTDAQIEGYFHNLTPELVVHHSAIASAAGAAGGFGTRLDLSAGTSQGRPMLLKEKTSGHIVEALVPHQNRPLLGRGAWLAACVISCAGCATGRYHDAYLVLGNLAAAAGDSRLERSTAEPSRTSITYTIDGRSNRGDLYLPGEGVPEAGVVSGHWN